MFRGFSPRNSTLAPTTSTRFPSATGSCRRWPFVADASPATPRGRFRRPVLAPRARDASRCRLVPRLDDRSGPSVALLCVGTRSKRTRSAGRVVLSVVGRAAGDGSDRGALRRRARRQRISRRRCGYRRAALGAATNSTRRGAAGAPPRARRPPSTASSRRRRPKASRSARSRRRSATRRCGAGVGKTVPHGARSNGDAMRCISIKNLREGHRRTRARRAVARARHARAARALRGDARARPSAWRLRASALAQPGGLASARSRRRVEREELLTRA